MKKYRILLLFSILASGTLYTMEKSADAPKANHHKIFDLIAKREWAQVKKLIPKKDIIIEEKDGNSVLCAILNEMPYEAGQQEVLECLLSQKKSNRLINKPGYNKDKKSMTALQLVVSAIDPNVLKIVDPDQTLTDYRITPAIMDLLLEHGEDPGLKNNNNQSAIQMAEALEQKELTDFLSLTQAQRRSTVITKPTKQKHCIIL